MQAFFISKKKLMLYGILLVLIVVTVWGGMKAWGNEKDEVVSSDFEVSDVLVAGKNIETGDDFFSEYRIERNRTRSERAELLREIVNNPASLAQTRQEAQVKLIEISDELEKESKIESALLAKGFHDAVAVIQAQAVMVIVPSAELLPEEAIKVADVVAKTVDCAWEDVIIVPR